MSEYMKFYLNTYWTRGWAEQKQRISIPVPALPVQEFWQEKKRKICNSLNWFKGVTFTFWIKMHRKNIFPKINSKNYKFSVFFSCQISCTGTAGTGIKILGSCSARPLMEVSSTMEVVAGQWQVWRPTTLSCWTGWQRKHCENFPPLLFDPLSQERWGPTPTLPRWHKRSFQNRKRSRRLR